MIPLTSLYCAGRPDPSRGVRSNSAQKNARDDRNERNLTGMSGIDKKMQEMSGI